MVTWWALLKCPMDLAGINPQQAPAPHRVCLAWSLALCAALALLGCSSDAFALPAACEARRDSCQQSSDIKKSC